MITTLMIIQHQEKRLNFRCRMEDGKLSIRANDDLYP